MNLSALSNEEQKEEEPPATQDISSVGNDKGSWLLHKSQDMITAIDSLTMRSKKKKRQGGKSGKLKRLLK